MSNVEEVTNIDELESGEQIPTFDYTNYVDVTLTEKHYYDNPKYNDGIHYTTKKALSQPFEYCFTNGGRNNGKTTGWQMQAVDDFFNNGMIYGKIVRKYTYSDEKNLDWFTQIVRDYVKEVWQHEIVVYRQNYYLVALECRPDRYLPLEKGKRKQVLNLKPFIKVFNLQYENDDKSHDFNYIKRFIFEEYALINQWEYLSDEITHFNSLISTVNREREDLSVVFIGNTISKHNPYFEWLGINVNKLKLHAGESRMLTCSDYKDGARIFVEQIPTVYGDKIKCPRILRVGGNEIAISGEWNVSENVIKTSDDAFINKVNKRLNFAIKTDNKIYYHFTCQYRNSTFNVITNRIKNVKASGLIYEYDCNTLERIKNGTLSKSKVLELLAEVINLETVYADDEIEYKYNKIKGRNLK